MYKTILKIVFSICLFFLFDLAISQECDYTIFNEFAKVPYIESKDMGQYKFPSAGDWYIGRSNYMSNFDKEELEENARQELSNNISINVNYTTSYYSYDHAQLGSCSSSFFG